VAFSAVGVVGDDVSFDMVGNWSLLGVVGGLVGAAVIDYDDFAGEVVFTEEVGSGLDVASDFIGFVIGRYDDGQFHCTSLGLCCYGLRCLAGHGSGSIAGGGEAVKARGVGVLGGAFEGAGVEFWVESPYRLV